VLHVTRERFAFHSNRVLEELNLETTAELIHFAYQSRCLITEPNRRQLSLHTASIAGPLPFSHYASSCSGGLNTELFEKREDSVAQRSVRLND